MPTEITIHLSAIITGVFTLLGVGVALIGGHYLTVYRDEKRATTSRTSLAETLLVEVHRLAIWFRDRGAKWNGFESSKKDRIVLELRGDCPPNPQLFRAVANRVDNLGATVAPSVVAFYVAVDSLISRFELWTENPVSTIKGEELADMAKFWRAVCAKAIAALDALLGVHGINKSVYPEANLQKLQQDLAEIVGTHHTE